MLSDATQIQTPQELAVNNVKPREILLSFFIIFLNRILNQN